MAGSFLNVVASRYREDKFLFSKKNLGGRSRCPQCRKQLNWYELIPLISFFIQMGKCRGCRQSISWQYPLVELLSGLIFLIPISANFLYAKSLSLEEYFGVFIIFFLNLSMPKISVLTLFLFRISINSLAIVLFPDPGNPVIHTAKGILLLISIFYLSKFLFKTRIYFFGIKSPVL